jgi:hypothetical protein
MTRRTSRKRTSIRRNSNPGGVVVGDIVRSSVFSGQAKVKKIVGAMADVKHEYGGTFPVSLDSLFVEPKGTKFGRSLRRNSNPAPSKSWQRKMGLTSADTEMSVRREIAAAEKARARALEALEHAVFVDKVSKDEERYFKDALERANAKQFQARIKLSSLGLRKNSRKLRRNSLRPPTWENYNEDTGVVLDRFSSRLDAVREAEDWRRSGFRVSSRKIGLQHNSADWSTRTAVAAKARAAFARGDSRSANRYLSELSAIDLAMMPRAVRRNGRRRTSRR